MASTLEVNKGLILSVKVRSAFGCNRSQPLVRQNDVGSLLHNVLINGIESPTLAPQILLALTSHFRNEIVKYLFTRLRTTRMQQPVTLSMVFKLCFLWIFEMLKKSCTKQRL